MDLILIRDTFDPHETLGKIQAGEAIYASMEQPWNNDQPDHSCLPAGTYRLVPHISGHLHEADGVTPLQTWALVNEALGVFHSQQDVPADYSGGNPARTECLIHPANFASQLEGCISPGTSRQQYGDVWEVIDSRIAFDAIRQYLGSGTSGNTITISSDTVEGYV